MGLLLISAATSNAASAAKGYPIIYLLYVATAAHPERGDTSVADMEKQGLFNDQFFSCLATLTQRYEQFAQDYYGFCDEVYAIDSAARSNCYQNNEAVKTYNWLRDIYPVTRKQVQWSDTNTGRGAVQAKDLIGDSLYAQMVRQYVLPQQTQLTCK
jgi:hypothetical protein